LLTFIRLFLSSHIAVVAENVFLRKQLALFQERKTRPRRTSALFRLAMVALAKFFDWRDALAIVKPETFVGWQRTAFKMFWPWKSRKPGRPALPKNVRELISQMARENPKWGKERIANELSLKLGIRVSPRTVGKYLDFFVSVTASFRILYVFFAMEVGSRRILHANVTAHPTADWTTQQFREFLAFDHPYRFVIHDRDAIFSSGLDAALKGTAYTVVPDNLRLINIVWNSRRKFKDGC
jgi:hypothetical protein